MSKIKQFIKNLSPFNNRTEMPKMLYVIKVILIFYVFKFGSELVGEAFALAAHFVCGKNPLQGDMFDAETIRIISYLGYSLMIGVIIIFWKLFQKKSLAELGFTKRFGSYFAGAAAGVVLIMVSVIPVILAGALQLYGVFENINTGIILLMIICFILQGAMEEVLCRGVVQQLLQKNTSVPVALGVSALLFTVSHINNMEGADPVIAVVAVVNLILISLIFSLLTVRFKSIWAACGMHSVWNYILFTVFGLNMSGNAGSVNAVLDIRSAGDNILNGGIYGIEAGIITTAVLAVGVGICIFLFRKDLKMTAGKLSHKKDIAMKSINA